MIGWLSGTIRQLCDDHILIDTGGVGYDVCVPTVLISSMGEIGQQIGLFIHTHVREDAIVLFGFRTSYDRDVFHHLLSVAGIGAKTALAILSSLPTDQLVEAIATRNIDVLQRTPGIGKKTAERLVLELKDRMKELSRSQSTRLARSTAPPSVEDEIVSALINLGYRRVQAEAALEHVDLSNFTSFDQALRETLKALSKA